jgi:p24 family protein beta-1
MYQLCFSNIMSPNDKELVFNVHMGDYTRDDIATLEHISPLDKTIMKLSESLSEIQNDQVFLRSREHAHRDVVEATSSNLVWWSLFEMCILIGTSVWQLNYLKKFVEVNQGKQIV